MSSSQPFIRFERSLFHALADAAAPFTMLEAALFIKDHVYTSGRLADATFYARKANWPCAKRMQRLLRKMYDMGCLAAYHDQPTRHVQHSVQTISRYTPPAPTEPMSVQALVFNGISVPILGLDYGAGLKMGHAGQRYQWAQQLRADHPENPYADDLTTVSAALAAGLTP